MGRDSWSRGAATLAVAIVTALATAGHAAANDGGVKVERAGGSSSVRFLRLAPGSEAAAAGSGGSIAHRARTLARSLRGDLGLGSSDNFEVIGVDRPGLAGPAVRLQQLYRGVPVLGAQVIARADGARQQFRSVSGETRPVSVDVAPSMSESAASRTALAAAAKQEGLSEAGLSPGQGTLQVYEPRIIGAPGPSGQHLAWRFDVTSTDGTIDRLVLIDAHSGALLLSFSQIDNALERHVCDAGDSDSRVPCEPPYARTEGQPPTGDRDTDLAYRYAGATYHFYRHRLGRDSIDGKGLPLISTVQYCEGSCPYGNAGWNSQLKQMDYGTGFAAADDVVGHELTHGVTSFTSNLYYYYQSGAINESLSDIFGEFIDLTDGLGTDTPQVRWLIGEDLPKEAGTLRDMKDPPASNDPDRMRSRLYWARSEDQGGVHTNSGVGNKLAYLLTDGDRFRGHDVKGLGINRVAKLFYLVNTSYLTSGANYGDLGFDLRKACGELRRSGQLGKRACTQVRRAEKATQLMYQPRRAPTMEAPVCRRGQARVRFHDGFEHGRRFRRQWTSGQLVGAASPWKRTGDYASSGKYGAGTIPGADAGCLHPADA